MYIQQEIVASDELAKHQSVLKDYSSKLFSYIKELDEFGQLEPIKAERSDANLQHTNYSSPSNRSPYPIPNMHHSQSHPNPNQSSGYPPNDFQNQMEYNQNPQKQNQNQKHAFLVQPQASQTSTGGSVGSIPPLSQENVSGLFIPYNWLIKSYILAFRGVGVECK